MRARVRQPKGCQKLGLDWVLGVPPDLHGVDTFRREGELLEPDLVPLFGGGDLVSLGREGRLERRDELQVTFGSRAEGRKPRRGIWMATAKNGGGITVTIH